MVIDEFKTLEHLEELKASQLYFTEVSSERFLSFLRSGYAECSITRHEYTILSKRFYKFILYNELIDLMLDSFSKQGRQIDETAELEQQ